jgi:hypothetical protein
MSWWFCHRLWPKTCPFYPTTDQILNGNETAINITNKMEEELKNNQVSEGGLVQLVGALDSLLDRRRGENGTGEDFAR